MDDERQPGQARRRDVVAQAFRLRLARRVTPLDAVYKE